jgi:hypothetical protein
MLFISNALTILAKDNGALEMRGDIAVEAESSQSAFFP